jgi:hypothetical protein
MRRGDKDAWTEVGKTAENKDNNWRERKEEKSRFMPSAYPP